MLVGITDANGNQCQKNVPIVINAAPTICPDWTQLLWGAATIDTNFGHLTNDGTGSFTPNNLAADSFHAHCNSPDALFGGDEVQVSNTATISYSGTGCNCNINIALTLFSDNNLLNELFATVFIQQDGNTILFNVNPGDNAFSLVDTLGATQTILVTVFIWCPTSQPSAPLVSDHEFIDIVGTITNVP